MGGYVDESNARNPWARGVLPRGPNSSMPPYDQVFEPKSVCGDREYGVRQMW